MWGPEWVEGFLHCNVCGSNHLERTPQDELNDPQQPAVEHIRNKQGRVAEFTRTLHERLNKER